MSDEQAMEVAQAVREQIIESLTSGVIAVDQNGVVVTSNNAACQHLGIADGTLTPGTALSDVPIASHFIEVIDELIKTEQTVSRRELTLKGQGGKRTIGVTASSLRGPEGYTGAILLFIDLTELRRLERAASVNKQLAQVGELTAGVVHEIRNPLSVISGMSEMLLRKLEDVKLKRKAQLIHEEASGLGLLIHEFLSFAKPFEVQRRPFPVADLIDRSLILCEELAKGKNVTLDSRCDGNVDVIAVDPEKLSQAISNLMRNAVEAVGPDGKVRISFEDREDDYAFRVEDSGTGLDPDDMVELLSPFFSKKEEGTGLGLPIVNRIVIAHGGNFEYGNLDAKDSDPYCGAWFEIRLPKDMCKVEIG